MKIDITLLTSPQIFHTRFPISGRIVSNNLMNDKHFNVNTTEHIQLKIYAEGFKRWSHLRTGFNSDDSNYDVFAKEWLNLKYGKFQWNSRFALFYIYTGAMDDIILENVKTDIVFFTAYSIIDWRMVKLLLENDKRVVVGGTSTMIYSFDELRGYLIKMGVPRDKVEKNLIIVSGYVDLTTDLYDIYDKWVDKQITENDFTTFWDCTEDGFMDYIKIYRTIFDTHINSIMTSKCFWGKCKFCTYTHLPKVNFVDGTSIDKLLEYFNILRKNYQSDNVFFNDSYLVNNDFNTQLFKELTADGFNISLYSGIKLLSRPKYLDWLNECNISALCCGVESVNDFSLDYIQKGYHRKDILEAFDLVCKHLNSDITFYSLIMTDLARNSKNKTEAIKEIQGDWEQWANIKRKLIDNDFHVQLSVSPLRHFPKTDMVDGNLIRFAEKGQMSYQTLSGLFGVYDYFSRKLDIDISEIIKTTCINQPIVRYLPNGEFLESDMHYVDGDIQRYVCKWE